MISSELDSVQGIGPKKEIINVIFWIHKEYQNASLDELLQVNGINTKDAKK